MRNIRFNLWFLIFALLLGPLSARGVSAEGTFTLEQVLSAPYPTNLVAARDVDRIAWVFNSEGARNVWTAAGPDFVPVNLTRFVRDEVFEIPDVEMTADGSIAVFVRGGTPNSRGWVTNPKSDPAGVEQAIWAVRTDGGSPWRVCAGSRPVLSPDGRSLLVVRDDLIYRVTLLDPSPSGQAPELLFRAAGRNGSPVWSPDQTRVAFVSNREDHGFVGVFDLAARQITWLAPSVDRDSEPAWSPDGQSIVFFRRPGAQFNETFDYYNPPLPSVWVADARTGSGKEIWRPSPVEPKYFSIRNLTWTAKNRILFTAEHDEWNHVFSLPPGGGAEPEDLTPGDGMVENLALSPDGGTLFYSSNQADIQGRQVFRAEAAGKAGTRPVALTKPPFISCYPAVPGSGKEVVFLQSTARQPLSVVRIPAAGGKTQIIAPRALPERFPLNDLVTPELVIVKAADGLDIPCQLFLPKGAKPGDRRPGVVYTHGGPVRQMLLGWHYMEFYTEAYGINQYFANRGYVVISINYRSGIGYGRRFRMPPDAGRRGASEYQDLLAGARYLQSRPEVDPERVGLWGLSYGGYLTAMGLARNSDVFKAGVDLAGVHDWSSRSREPRPGTQALSDEDRKAAFESSPVASIKTWTSPVLFIHGDDDRNVSFSQTVDLVQKLRAKGDVHVELMVRPDEPHEFLLHKNRRDAYNAIFEFLDRFLGRK